MYPKFQVVINPLRLSVLNDVGEEKKKKIIASAIFLPEDGYDKYGYIPMLIFSVIIASFFDASCITIISRALGVVPSNFVDFLCYLTIFIMASLIFVNVILRCLVKRKIIMIAKLDK